MATHAVERAAVELGGAVVVVDWWGRRGFQWREAVSVWIGENATGERWEWRDVEPEASESARSAEGGARRRGWISKQGRAPVPQLPASSVLRVAAAAAPPRLRGPGVLLLGSWPLATRYVAGWRIFFCFFSQAVEEFDAKVMRMSCGGFGVQNDSRSKELFQIDSR
jgi:hypothetical protein